MRRALTALTLAAALAATGFSSPAAAEGVRSPGGLLDQSPQERSQMLSVYGFLPWGWGFGGAVRYSIPIVPQGFISKLNDSIDLEFGADFYSHWAFNDFGAIGVGEARWTFQILPKLGVYGKAVVGLQYDTDWGVGPYWDFVPGVIFQLNDTLALRGEVGYRGLRAGLGFSF
ncbi:MAG: hypothetical protein ACOX6T_07105 [Myxococcales bacterium]|jgi:hypothetical protein